MVSVAEVFLLALGALVLSVVGRFGIAYAETSGDDRLEEALSTTTRWLTVVVGGFVGAAMIGLVQLGDALGMITEFVGGHPFVVSNLAGIGLGAGALAGVFDLSPDQYVGLALMIVGVVFILQEVDARAG